MATRIKDRRRHKRFDVRCPILLTDPDGQVLCKGRTANLSDGGLFLALPVETLTGLGSLLVARLSVPRETPNTYMLEDFACQAVVLRHQPAEGDHQTGVALKFVQPLDLMLEV